MIIIKKIVLFSIINILLIIVGFTFLKNFDFQASAASRRLSEDGTNLAPSNTSKALDKLTTSPTPSASTNTTAPTVVSAPSTPEDPAVSSSATGSENAQKKTKNIFDILLSFIQTFVNFIMQTFGIENSSQPLINQNLSPEAPDATLASADNYNSAVPKVKNTVTNIPNSKYSSIPGNNLENTTNPITKSEAATNPIPNSQDKSDDLTNNSPTDSNKNSSTETSITPVPQANNNTSVSQQPKKIEKQQTPENQNKLGSKDSTLSFPIRGAFYYPWYPQTWTVNGKHVSYQVSSGYYSSSAQSTVDRHIKSLDYANINLGIASWWGQGKQNETTRIPMLFNRTEEMGSQLQWAIYYEKEGFGNPSVSEIKSDLDYLMNNYAKYSSYAKINGKPVLFVYNADDKSNEITKRWAEASAGDWYLVLKIFPGHEDSPNKPDAWHQYGPGTPSSFVSGCFGISPGFKKADSSSSLLTRDLQRWEKNVKEMVASNAPWQLILTFNEWGEGTAVESAKEWSSPSGYGKYLDILHNN